MPELKIFPLLFRLETIGGFRGPEYKGALIRGGFGKYFRELVCVTRAPTCTCCPHLTTCPYATVFETPVDPERMPVLRKYPNAPHPFVLLPPLDNRTLLPAGSPLNVGINLIGRGADVLPHFVRVFESMGETGHFGGRFRVRDVVSTSVGGAVYDGAMRRFVTSVPEWRPPAMPREVRSMAIEFLTPLRMRTDGRYNGNPDFAAIAQALLRRLHLLNVLYGDGNEDHTWTHRLLRQADEVKTEEAQFQWYSWSRMSGRQGRRVQMDGIVGQMRVSGPLTELAPLFEMGTLVHVGSGTSVGLGKYQVTWGE